MSRSGYSDNWSDYNLGLANLYRGAVKSAFRGKRGQAFLKEMLAALDAMPNKALIADKLEYEGGVCALGAVGKARGMDMGGFNMEAYGAIVGAFGIADAMAREIAYENDYTNSRETPEQRWSRMRAWIAKEIRDAAV
jgi:hypothetical protein